jgi:multidrug resistance efflux pump
VSEGDWVAPGEPLIQIEDKLLVSQLHQAESALGIAEANYALIAAGLSNEQKNAAISAAELALISSEYNLSKLFDDTDLFAAQALQLAESYERDLENLNNPDFLQAVALKAIADAEKAIEDAERRFHSVSSTADEADIAAAEAQVILSKDALEDAEEDYEPYEDKPADNLSRANFRAQLAAAQQVYDAAVRKLNALRGTGTKSDIAVAEANLVAAKAKLFEANREWERIKDGPKDSDIALLEAQIADAYQDFETYKNGPDPDDIALAESQVNNAKAQLALARADIPTQEELDVVKAQVESAQTYLEAIQVQIDLMVVKSPVSGVVMTRSIEPGEVVQPGLATMTIGRLDNLMITVYIPEDKYGQIQLGDIATIVADSFPGETFEATVTRIADRAEYTPRNIQTKEDRQTTVYAIELSVVDPDGKLKPGMPTDVQFK